MFEAAQVGNSIDDQSFDKEVPKLRADLLAAQRRLASADFSLVVVMSGVEGAGKSDAVNTLLEWLDARGIETHAMWEPTEEELERPPFWRFWRALPLKGRTGIFFGSWYTQPIVGRALKALDRAELDSSMDRVVEFEKMLTSENVLVVKFWLHITKEEQRRRFKKLEKDPNTSWKVTKNDWKYHKRYDKFREASEYALRRTNTAEAPWNIVEATDRNYRLLTIGRALLSAIQQRLDQPKPEPVPKPELPVPAAVNVIRRLDASKKMSKEDYSKKAPKVQAELARHVRDLYHVKRSMLLVFEGPDAAGKGGTIRRVTQCMDARAYKVISVAAPTDEERGHPYLWRFWRHLPRRGQVSIYDRSWYGRVLVERLEGYCAPRDWQRAFGEINEFEEQLAEFGTIVLKFWLSITADEQLRRFKDRETTPYKQYKIGPDDWRNRAKWDAYEAGACDMIEKTSTDYAPWILVEANDKDHARYKVLKTIAGRLREEL